MCKVHAKESRREQERESDVLDILVVGTMCTGLQETYDGHLRENLEIVALRHGSLCLEVRCFGMHVCGFCLIEAGDRVELLGVSQYI